MKLIISIFLLIFFLMSCNENPANKDNINVNNDNINVNNDNINVNNDINECFATINIHTETYLSPGQHNPIISYVSIYYPNGILRGMEQITDVNGNLTAKLDCTEPIGYYRIEAKTYNGAYIWQLGWTYIYFSGNPVTFLVDIILDHVSSEQ